MLLYCPDCQAAFTGVSRCPRCSGLLLMPEEAPPSADDQAQSPLPDFKPTPTARAAIGTVIALGLYLGLRKLTTAWVLASTEDYENWWLSADALVVVFVMQTVAAVFGAVLASAGGNRGISIGATIGGFCGGLFLIAEVAAGAPPTQLVLLLQPVILAVGGAIAGAVGSWYWAAVPEFELPPPLVKKSSSIELMSDAPQASGQPTIWYRIVIGAMIILAGINLAERMRHLAEKTSGGLLRVATRSQGEFLSWQIAALAVLAGGAFAGSGTGAGIRHGAYTGLLGSTGVAIVGIVRGEFSQPEEYFLNWMSLVAAGPKDPVGFLGVALGILVTSLIGGWFGGQLFLSLAPAHMRQHGLRNVD
jgi:hypothetical protein